jgi:hypothetical protein
MLSDWRCSVTEVWVRIPAREYSKMCLLSNLILEEGVNRIHLGLACLFRMTGDQITKVKLTNVSEILVQACFQFIELCWSF